MEAVLTTRCNLSCAYCYQNRKQPRSMSWKTLRAAVDLLLRSEREEVKLNFYGGEPLLELALLRRAVGYGERQRPAERRVVYGASTNGLLLDEGTAAFFARHGFELQLSFDGVAAAQEQRGRGTFPVLDSKLDLLRRRHPLYFRDSVSIGVTVTSANLPCLADTVDYFIAKGVGEINLAPQVTHDPGWGPESLAELERQFGRVFRTCLRHYERCGNVPLTLFRRQAGGAGRPRAGDAMCGAGDGQRLTVDVDGGITGCVVFVESYQRFPTDLMKECARGMRLGHVAHPDLPRRLERYPDRVKALQLFDGRSRKRSPRVRCDDCRFLRECSVCPAAVGHIPGNADPHRIPDSQCDFNRVALGNRDRFPRQPSPEDVLLGRGQLPELLQELMGYPGSSSSGRRRAERG